jgi:hypothetical protein
MSYKTDRLVDLFPDVYAAGERESLLYKLLDAVAAELLAADAAVKLLLKSHWVDYAAGRALDGLGAIYGVGRRRVRDGSLETDDAFRRRLRSVVPLFTGGGTVRAVKGAVQSALGLPFDLGDLRVSPALRADLEELVDVEEFPPVPARVVFDAVTRVGDDSELLVEIDTLSAREASPRIEWTFTTGSGRRLSLERLDVHEGIKAAEDALLVPPGATLTLSAAAGGALTAVLDGEVVTAAFTDLDGGTPPRLPAVPPARSQWRFRARGGLFDLSGLDEETFDPPLFGVELRWLRFEPLTFDVTVPYFLQAVVAQLVRRHGHTGEVFVFQGLPLDVIQQVVDQTRAAGVRGSVHFSLNFLEDHEQGRWERLAIAGGHRAAEDAGAVDALTIGSLSRTVESHQAADRFAVGAEFDLSTFDEAFGYQ